MSIDIEKIGMWVIGERFKIGRCSSEISSSIPAACCSFASYLSGFKSSTKAARTTKKASIFVTKWKKCSVCLHLITDQQSATHVVLARVEYILRILHVTFIVDRLSILYLWKLWSRHLHHHTYINFLPPKVLFLH